MNIVKKLTKQMIRKGKKSCLYHLIKAEIDWNVIFLVDNICVSEVFRKGCIVEVAWHLVSQ